MVYVQIDPRSTRLGNWLFQYSAALTAHPSDRVAFYVVGGRHLAEPQDYAELWPEAEYVSELPAGVHPIEGLFQDCKFLDRNLVRERLKCPNRVEKLIAGKYGQFLEHGPVGISVRRGDYLRLPHRHPFVGEKYLRRAVEYSRDKGVTSFLVCSDDIAWCKKFFKDKCFGNCAFAFVEGEDVLTQLFIQSKCRGNILSNSSFSWWGAYLGDDNRDVIFPSMWYGPAVAIKDWSGLYFEGAKVIKNGYTPRLWIKARWCMMKNFAGDILRKLHLR